MATTQDITDYEKERGKPLPSLNHGFVQSLIVGLFLEHRDRLTTITELSLDLGGLLVTPDVCVYPKMDVDLTRDQSVVNEAPLLAIEIQSPTQSTQDMMDKAREMIDAGVQSVWIVQPTIHTVTLIDETIVPNTVTEGTFTDPATDVTVTLDDIFDA
jgi:Uma2 family endonuclease